MPARNISALSAGEIGGNTATSANEDRSGAAIQWQHYQIGLKATNAGASLGIGRRSVPNPSAQFSMSGSQFGGGHAKQLYGGGEEEE